MIQPRGRCALTRSIQDASSQFVFLVSSPQARSVHLGWKVAGTCDYSPGVVAIIPFLTLIPQASALIPS